MEEPVIVCQRCGRDGGQATYGWAILCAACKREDEEL